MGKLAVVIFVIFTVCMALLATFNTDSTTVVVPFYNTYELSKIALILISSGAGALLVLLIFIVRDTKRLMATYQFQKKQKKEEKIHILFAKALNALQADDFLEARRFLDDILKDDPDHPDALMRLGDVASREEKYDEALKNYKRALTASHDNLEILKVLFLLASLSARLKRWDETLEHVEDILEKDPGNLGALQLKRLALERMGKWDDLIEVQKGIIKAEQKVGHGAAKAEDVLSGYRYEQARESLEQGQLEKADKGFRNILRTDEKFIPAYLGVSEALVRGGDTEEAVAFLEKGYKTTSSALLLAATEDLLINMGEPSRLIRLYRDALATNPHNNMLRFFLGKLYYRLEMVDDGLETLGSGDVPEEFPQWNRLLGELYLRRNQCERAVEEFKKTIDFKKTLRLPYCCGKCGHPDDEWSGRCPSCGSWNTYEFNLHGSCKI